MYMYTIDSSVLNASQVMYESCCMLSYSIVQGLVDAVLTIVFFLFTWFYENILKDKVKRYYIKRFTVKVKKSMCCAYRQ